MADVVLTGAVDGYAVLPAATPLTRLNFFDGRRLSGADLRAEQQAGRELTFALGRVGGPGVGHGMDVTLSGEKLTVTPGLVIDPPGRVLLLTQPVTATVAAILAATEGRTKPPPKPGGKARFDLCDIAVEETPAVTAQGVALYVLTVGWVEGLCGNAEVFGAACETACVTATDRTYRIDGVVLRLRPLLLDSPLPGSTTVPLTGEHLRSRVAAAYFSDERADGGPQLSAVSKAWCHGATGPTGREVPLAVLGRAGDSTVFLDEWTARRERVETPAGRQFDGRIAARPLSVFSAQLGQFQCHLADVVLPLRSDRKLIDAGIVEVPPFGYLEMPPGVDVLAASSLMLGPGVDVRLVPTPADLVPREAESVRHRDRIPLLAGVDDPARKVPVDVLVPGAVSFRRPLPLPRPRTIRATLGADGLELLGSGDVRPRGEGFTVSAAVLGGASSQQAAASFVEGLARGEVAVPPPARSSLDLNALRDVAAEAGAHAVKARGDLSNAGLFSARFSRDEAKPLAVYGTLTVDRNPFETGDAIVSAQLDAYTPGGGAAFASVEAIGRLRPIDGGRLRFTGQLTAGPGSMPARFEADVATDGEGWVITAGEVTLRLTTGDDQSDHADVALRLLRGGRVDDPTFYESAREAVFGAALVVGRAPVFTNQGWVAFKRRDPEPPAPPVTTRTVLLWEATADNVEEARLAERSLRAGLPVRLVFKRVTEVVFRTGSAELVTTAAELRAAYQASGGAPVVQFFGYGPPEMMPAGPARVEAIRTALGPLLVTDTATVDAVPDPPTDLLAPQTDGSMFLIVYPRPVRTATLQVVGLDLNFADQSSAKLAATALRDRDGARFQTTIGAAVTSLGTISLTESQIDPKFVAQAVKVTSKVVSGLVVDTNTPVLWLDGQWANGEPRIVDVMVDACKQIAGGTKGQLLPPALELRDVQTVVLDTTQRNGLLIYQFRKG
ncbi:hypothetical protein SK803_14320 [Lentzea sp. BCCO 10_0856]|uniref:Uncharacterized protein n=1 Tax=Lentzea miocenica TaxID=3095431 RepID=A0ABU4SZQ5_9PSEU|nr:hypothetical protein [Lentzea sp. BCCO 10_0856]MDX8031400.1 hypothetical protein [Lentzea sp. BCCO 10_0856]